MQHIFHESSVCCSGNVFAHFFQEIPAEQVDKSSAYLLFYEREDLSAEAYMPRVPGGWAAPDTKDLDEELDTDFKKQCVVM